MTASVIRTGSSGKYESPIGNISATFYSKRNITFTSKKGTDSKKSMYQNQIRKCKYKGIWKEPTKAKQNKYTFENQATKH